VIIQHAVWLYLRFTLSYRDVEELLAERGLDISYETVRVFFGLLKFGPVIARRLRRCVPRPSNRWHLDEMVVRIAGERCICGGPVTRGRSPRHAGSGAAVPYRPAPSKVMLSNATFAKSIEKVAVCRGCGPSLAIRRNFQTLHANHLLRSSLADISSPELLSAPLRVRFSENGSFAADRSLRATWDVSINEWWTLGRRNGDRRSCPP